MRWCACTRARRAWLDDGSCATCKLRVHETSIMDAVKAVMVADPKCLLWRNEIGHNTHFPDGRKRDYRIEYGVCNPGGADLIGMYGPYFLAVETKTVRGKQNPDQIDFEQRVIQRGGTYAICRSVSDAEQLLSRLRSGEAP